MRIASSLVNHAILPNQWRGCLTEHAHVHSPKSMAACISLLQVVPQLPQQWELVPIHGNDKAQTCESGIAITNIEPYTMYQLRIPSKVQNETSKSVFNIFQLS